MEAPLAPGTVSAAAGAGGNLASFSVRCHSCPCSTSLPPSLLSQVNCMKYSAPSASKVVDAAALPPCVLDKARAVAAAWPEADPGSVAVVHGSVIISGLFAWCGGFADPAPELDVGVDGLRLTLVAHGSAVGLTRAEPSRPPMIAFLMRPVDGSGAPFVQLVAASVRSLGALAQLALPCEGGSSSLTGGACGNLTLGGGCGSGSPRCWLHAGAGAGAEGM